MSQPAREYSPPKSEYSYPRFDEGRKICPNCEEIGQFVEIVDDHDCYWCDKCGWDWDYPAPVADQYDADRLGV